MQKYLRYKIIIILLLLATQFSYAIDKIKFKTISVDEGLSNSSVMAITQDLRGNVWIGTQDGLNRWNGHDFTVYMSDNKDEKSLNDGLIQSLLIASDGTLWVGTSLGLSCFDFQQNRFFNFSSPENKEMHTFDIIEVDGGNLILATNIGLVLFDKESGELKLDSYLSGITIRDLSQIDDRIVVGTTNGLYIHSVSLGTTVRILPKLADCDISNIGYKDGVCWIGTYGEGLYKCDSNMQVVKHYDKSSTPNFKSNHIHDLQILENNDLWIGTYNGLSILTEHSGEFVNYSSSDGSLIGHNSIRSIFLDKQNGVWLGSYYGGVSYYNSLANKFGVLSFNKQSSLPADNIIGCIVKDTKTDNLWVGTNDVGLLYYDIRTGEFTHYKDTYHNPSDKVVASQNIKCIHPDKGGNLYFGKHVGGLNYLNRKTGRMENFAISDNSPLNNSCYSLLEGDNNTLWVGTLSGLFSFDKRTKRFSRHVLTDYEPKLALRQIMSLNRDSKGRVWIGTDAGLFQVSADGERIKAYTNANMSVVGGKSKEVDIQCVVEDSRRNIWIGAKSGLFLFNEHNDTFKHYTMHDGLPNNFVYGILEDDLYRLWISTNRGLACFDIYQNTFRNYSKSDGIANNQFNSYAYCKDKTGVFYFGGLGGLTYFSPYELLDNPYVPAARVESVRIFNEDSDDLQDVVVERDSVGAIFYATFPSELNLFSLTFEAANPLSGSRAMYSYMLEGFDTQWYMTTNRSVSYSNLPPGTYYFRVKASNNDGKWSAKEVVVKIFISPMWWQTLFARMLFVTLFLCLVGVVIWFLTSRVRMKFMLAMERKEKLHAEELGQEKIRFYINLSHELRTPLTLILSPLQEIGSHCAVDKYVQTRLKFIYRSSTKLLYIVNQMLDYRKTELGMFKLKVSLQDIDKVVGEVFTLFEKTAQDRDVDYILNSELKGNKYPVDSTFLEIILTNLLSNAFKFTPEGGVVKLSLQRVDGRVLISVRDNGIGIAANKQNEVFERFYQIDESRSGTGIGLSIVKRLVKHHHGTIVLNSEQGKFTEVIVSLPDDINSYSEDKRAENADVELLAMKDKAPLYMSEAYVVDDDSQIVDEDVRETILVADKSGDICRYMVDHFKGKYKVHAVSDGQQALDMLKSVRPDVVIADRALPTIDGLKLCLMIKQNIRTCHIPVIILAAKDGVEDQITGIEAGADDYVSKPFSISLLQAKISNLLKSKYRLQHYYSDNSEIEPDKIASNSMDGEFLKRAIDVVEQNMSNEDFSSNDFAQALYMSRSNLHLKMKSITGESSTKFIRKIRFNYACKLILERKHSIAEISCMVGFNSPSYFATSFKKHIGCLPTEYVRSNKGVSRKDG